MADAFSKSAASLAQQHNQALQEAIRCLNRLLELSGRHFDEHLDDSKIRLIRDETHELLVGDE